MDAAVDTKKGLTTRIVLVDDEPAILNALKRTLFDLNCQIRTAENAKDALDLLSTEPAEIIVSDMRMPHMDGAEFLTEVATKWPDTERILLTGFSDMESTVAAINKGKINYYLEKPWDDDRLRKIISKGIELAEIKHRNTVLEAQVIEQNSELKNWNEKLEQQVAERTTELNLSNSKLQASVNELHGHYQTTVQLFSNLIEQRLGNQQAKGSTFVWVLKRLAKHLELPETDTKQLSYAGVLRNVGKVSLPDELLKTPYLSLSPEQQRAFHRHTIIAATMLSSTPPLLKAAHILAQREEHEDGSGYPNGLKQTEIDLPAAILCLVGDYFAYCQGLIDPLPLTPSQALNQIKSLSGQYYRAEVVAAFESAWPELCHRYQIQNEDQLSSNQLKAGMVLSRDLKTSCGTLLLAEGKELDAAIIKHLKKLEHSFQEKLDIYVLDEHS